MNSNNFKQNFINAVLGKLGSNTKYSPEIENWLQTLPEEQRIGAANGKNFGNKDILAKQQELNIPIPQGQEQLTLANEGKFNPYTHGAVRQGGLINGYNQGYNLQYDNPSGQISTRIGQALGTAKRGFDSPLGRALVAYGASRMLGDENPLKQAGIAYGTRQNANTANQLYRQQLNQMGIDTSKIGGDINDAMYKNMILGQNASNKWVTYNTLAADNPDIAAKIARGEIDGNALVPLSLGREMYSNKRGLTNARIENLNAKTKTEDAMRDVKVQKIRSEINKNNAQITKIQAKIAAGTATDADKVLGKKLDNINKALKVAEGLEERGITVSLKDLGVDFGSNNTPASQPKTAIISKGGKQYRIDASRRKEYEAQGGTFVRYE